MAGMDITPEREKQVAVYQTVLRQLRAVHVAQKGKVADVSRR
jgi:hypothetical protein